MIETTNIKFNSLSHFGVVYNGMSDENLRVVERLTRTGSGTLLYRATIDDPTVFTKPWTIEIPMIRASGPVFEYACHEGNYGLVGILAGARAQEKESR